MKETIEHNNRFYGEELKTESEQLKEWLIVANKEIERLKEELEYTIPIVEHNKTITKHLKEKERLKEELEKLNGELRRYKSIVYLCEKVKDCDKE